eukprot:COSAG01_NODE_10_length_42970_cov_93.010007_30_plen_112_part_00
MRCCGGEPPMSPHCPLPTRVWAEIMGSRKMGNRREISASSDCDQSHYAGCCTRGNGGKQIIMIGAAVLVASTTGTVHPTTVTPPPTPAPPSQHDRRRHGAAAVTCPRTPPR